MTWLARKYVFMSLFIGCYTKRNHIKVSVRAHVCVCVSNDPQEDDVRPDQRCVSIPNNRLSFSHGGGIDQWKR